MKISLKEIENGDYQLLYLSNVKIGSFEHGGDDPDTYFLLRIEYTDQWGDDYDGGKYHATICACGPGWPVGDNPFSSLGISREEFLTLPTIGQLQVLIDCGLCAPLWQKSGSNLATLKRLAREELQSLRMLCGFALDQPVNRIGSSGWDLMRGDITAGLKSHC